MAHWFGECCSGALLSTTRCTYFRHFVNFESERFDIKVAPLNKAARFSAPLRAEMVPDLWPTTPRVRTRGQQGTLECSKISLQSNKVGDTCYAGNCEIGRFRGRVCRGKRPPRKNTRILHAHVISQKSAAWRGNRLDVLDAMLIQSRNSHYLTRGGVLGTVSKTPSLQRCDQPSQPSLRAKTEAGCQCYLIGEVVAEAGR